MSQIIIEQQDKFTLISLKGQFIGGDETDTLRNKLKEINETDKNKLIIDLEKVTYCNSTALGVLISANNNYIRNNGKIVLCNINKSIESIIQMTKLNLVFTITKDIESAINLI